MKRKKRGKKVDPRQMGLVGPAIAELRVQRASRTTTAWGRLAGCDRESWVVHRILVLEDIHGRGQGGATACGMSPCAFDALFWHAKGIVGLHDVFGGTVTFCGKCLE
jgi:hypothetical protein